MLPDWQQNIFSIFFKLFKRLPKYCQNGCIFIFSNFSKFQALVKMLLEWQHFNFFIKFFQISIACQNVAILEKFDQVFEKTFLLPFWQHFGIGSWMSSSSVRSPLRTLLTQSFTNIVSERLNTATIDDYDDNLLAFDRRILTTIEIVKDEPIWGCQ